MSRRRTQAERRQETIGKLLDATIECLAERGYANTSTSKICKRAGVSQGGLFNHFDTRVDVIVAATDRICQQHVAQFEVAAAAADEIDQGLVRQMVEFIRMTARSPRHAAWHEVMVAARTDDDLRDGVHDALGRFERALLQTAARVLDVGQERAERLGVVLLSLMHMFDSEAVTVAVHPNAALEEARVEWVTELLQRELAGRD
jgi:AcrR family transcriptional regulator